MNCYQAFSVTGLALAFALQSPQDPSAMHPVSPNPPAHHTTVKEQMAAAKARREAAEAQRKALGQSIRDHLHQERQQRLTGEGQVGAQADADRERVQEEAAQIHTQVETRHNGGFHATDPGLDWRGLATNSGQLNAAELAAQDPTLSFEGKAGAPYPVGQYLRDRSSRDPAARVRAVFLAKPYFFRDGVRYERTTVFLGSQRCYQFVKR